MTEIITNIETIAAEAKLASGLVHVSGLDTGITRKSGADGFLYYRPDGRRIKEAGEIKRLNSLAIPNFLTTLAIRRSLCDMQEFPGQSLFHYANQGGAARAISSHNVNDYIREVTGDDLSLEQFRAWGATCMAVEALAALEAAATQRELTRQLNEAVDSVAAKLVNTRVVCRSSYIHPAVFEDFQSGMLRVVLKLKTKSERLLQWLDAEEIGVLRGL